MGWGTSAQEADRAARDRAFEAAAHQGLGEHVTTVNLGSRIRGLGCVSAMVGLVLLPPGIGLLSGPGGATTKTVAVMLVVLGIALPVCGLRVEGRLTHRDTRLYVFDRGLVVTDHDRIVPCAWPDLRIEERTVHGTYGSAGHGYTAHWLHLSAYGVPLCRLNANNSAARHIPRSASDAGLS
ncbi:hypothetical protein [Streptomyces sp. NPDC001508]|uniref:hypothetical protein n=1 Tax=Streptomyces sp. NPDC001508 TaxID=3154656 RepID=UPI003318E331